MLGFKVDGIVMSWLVKSILLVCGLILPFFYYRIYVCLKQSKSRAVSNSLKTNLAMFDFELNKGLLFSLMFFSFTYFSFSLLIFTRNYSCFVCKYLFLISRMNPVLNPILYATTNSMFRNAYAKIFSFLFYKIKHKELVIENEMLEIN